MRTTKLPNYPTRSLNIKKFRSQYLWGTLLILMGILFLLQEFNLIGSAWDSMWAVIMGVAGIVFLWVYATDKAQWWAAIPGMTLLGLTATALGGMFPTLPASDLLGSVFLTFVGAGFWLVYFRQPSFWWAIIPGGTLVTLGFVSGLETSILPTEGIFFLGLGITFGLVGLLPAKQFKTGWAYIPGTVLTLLGLAQLIIMGTQMINYWPVVLIIVGGYLILRNWRK